MGIRFQMHKLKAFQVVLCKHKIFGIFIINAPCNRSLNGPSSEMHMSTVTLKEGKVRSFPKGLGSF